MKKAQKNVRGYGIAACQLGYSKAIFTFIDPRGQITAAINPEIVDTWGTVYGPESCLSLPGKTFSITRPQRVTMTFLDVDGKPQTIEATGLLARCLAHEADHLLGKLIIDNGNI